MELQALLVCNFLKKTSPEGRVKPAPALRTESAARKREELEASAGQSKQERRRGRQGERQTARIEDDDVPFACFLLLLRWCVVALALALNLNLALALALALALVLTLALALARALSLVYRFVLVWFLVAPGPDMQGKTNFKSVPKMCPGGSQIGPFGGQNGFLEAFGALFSLKSIFAPFKNH